MSSETAVVSIEAFMYLIMSQQGRRKTKRLLDFQARNQFGTPGGEKSFLGGDSFFILCPMVSKYVQYNFPIVTKIFLGEASSPPGYGPVDFYTSQKSKRFLVYFIHVLFTYIYNQRYDTAVHNCKLCTFYFKRSCVRNFAKMLVWKHGNDVKL